MDMNTQSINEETPTKCGEKRKLNEQEDHPHKKAAKTGKLEDCKQGICNDQGSTIEEVKHKKIVKEGTDQFKEQSPQLSTIQHSTNANPNVCKEILMSKRSRYPPQPPPIMCDLNMTEFLSLIRENDVRQERESHYWRNKIDHVMVLIRQKPNESDLRNSLADYLQCMDGLEQEEDYQRPRNIVNIARHKFNEVNKAMVIGDFRITQDLLKDLETTIKQFFEKDVLENVSKQLEKQLKTLQKNVDLALKNSISKDAINAATQAQKEMNETLQIANAVLKPNPYCAFLNAIREARQDLQKVEKCTKTAERNDCLMSFEISIEKVKKLSNNMDYEDEHQKEEMKALIFHLTFPHTIDTQYLGNLHYILKQMFWKLKTPSFWAKWLFTLLFDDDFGDFCERPSSNLLSALKTIAPKFTSCKVYFGFPSGKSNLKIPGWVFSSRDSICFTTPTFFGFPVHAHYIHPVYMINLSLTARSKFKALKNRHVASIEE